MVEASSVKNPYFKESIEVDKQVHIALVAEPIGEDRAKDSQCLDPVLPAKVDIAVYLYDIKKAIDEVESFFVDYPMRYDIFEKDYLRRSAVEPCREPSHRSL